jgi:microcystin-dependent protein
MAASITKAGETLIAQKQAAQETLIVARFILALIPDLDVEAPVDRDALKPPDEQIAHIQEITQAGFVNPNQVVYSLMMGSDIGDFDWNWIGLETAEDVLLTVAYVPKQEKRKYIPPIQIGNNVTRNFLLKFDGAQALTEITIDASTWQHDFTVRLHGIDERERLANRDMFGRACFFGDSMMLETTEAGYQLKAGMAYVEGIRLLQAEVLNVTSPLPPTRAWLDVALQRDMNDALATWVVKWGEGVTDYEDSAGVQHYCVPIATLDDSKSIGDERQAEPIDGPLLQYLAARNGDYSALRARATTKEDVGLGQLPNAKSDDPETDSSEILATTAALYKLGQQVGDSMVGMVAAFDMETAPPGWLKRNGADVSRTVFAKLFAVIGVRYGAGDGVTTFNVGDSRGLFIRGLDDGRGIDPDRALGTEQQGQNLSHDHAAQIAADGTHGHGGGIEAAGYHAHEISGSTSGAGNHAHALQTYGPWAGSSGASSFNSQGVGPVTSTAAAGEHSHSIYGATTATGAHAHGLVIHADGNHVHGITVSPNGGPENRPANTAFLICIKY